jgi:AAA domain
MQLSPTIPDPSQVFTPRQNEVNEQMYVRRPDLESALVRGLQGTKHLILHGESGSGKSWLYKKILRERNVVFLVANLANASRLGSIAAEFQNLLDREEKGSKTGFSETKSAGISAGVAKGDLSHVETYQIGEKEPFEALLAHLRKLANRSEALLVLDNLESIFNSATHLKELADLITLLDDDRYAEYRIKFLIVGVPSDLQKYFFKTPNMATVSNRVSELKEVFRLSPEQTKELVKRGFVDRLRYLTSSDPRIDLISEHVVWITDCIPQRIHEYCLKLAYAMQESNTIIDAILKEADKQWLQESLYQAYSALEASMNERETRVQRRNQVIYTIGNLKSSSFSHKDIEHSLRQFFPESTRYTTLNVVQILSELASREQPIIRRSPKGDAYVFADPVYRMCIRAMLTLDDEQVIKLELSSLSD